MRGGEGDARATPRGRAALAAAALALVAGCATPGPTVTPAPEPAVRELRPEAVSRCQLLGPVEATHANAGSVALNDLEAIETVRGRVARLGGNGFLVTDRDSGMWRSVIRADAYLCPSWEPVPGLPPR